MSFLSFSSAVYSYKCFDNFVKPSFPLATSFFLSLSVLQGHNWLKIEKWVENTHSVVQRHECQIPKILKWKCGIICLYSTEGTAGHFQFSFKSSCRASVDAGKVLICIFFWLVSIWRLRSMSWCTTIGTSWTWSRSRSI